MTVHCTRCGGEVLADSNVTHFCNPEDVEKRKKFWGEAYKQKGSHTPGEFDPVNKPKHYNSSPAVCVSCGTAIECIDIVRHMSFDLGNAVKYIWRCDLKKDAIEDLKKALWYIQDEIKKREGEKK